MPSGRNSISSAQSSAALAIEEPRSQAIDLSKTAFVFIMAAQIQQKTDFYGNTYFDIRDDVITVAEIIRLITEPPFSVPAERIHRFINSDKPEAIYDWFKTAAADPDLQNICVFYQGFTLLSAAEFMVNLRPLPGNDPGAAISLSFRTISGLLAAREDMNLYLFIDSDQSARVFRQVDAPNFVIFASCSEEQQSYIIESDQANKKISVFSYALIQSLKQMTQREGIKSANDLFLHVRGTMASLLANHEGKPLVQTPEISTRNLTPYYGLLPAAQQPDSEMYGPLQPSYTHTELHDLIVDNKIEKVLHILKMSNVAEAYETDLVSLRHQNKSLKSEEMLGIAEPEYYQRMRARLINNLTNFLKEIKAEYPRVALR